MSKISKKEKNTNPELFGYQHPWDIPGNTKKKIIVYCVPFEDKDGETRYSPCSKELYEWNRNEASKVFKSQDRLTRCWIYHKDGGLKHKCRCKCSECPYKKEQRDIKLVSIEYLYDEYNYEIEDKESDLTLDSIIKKDCIDEIKRLISLLKESDRLIVELFSKGLSDTEIARKLNRPRTTIKDRRTKLFGELKRQLKDF